MAPHDSDLLEGLHEWQPVQEIVRLTFKALHDVVKAQGEAVKNIERSIGQKVSKTENAALLAEKVNLTELSNTFDELSRIIDAKADAQDVGASLDRKANRSDVQAALKLKADVGEVQRCLDEKANVDEVQQLFNDMDERRVKSEERLTKLIEEKLAVKADQAELPRLREELQRETTEALNGKASKQAVATALRAKLGRGDVEQMIAEEASVTQQRLAAKADADAVNSALAARISKLDLREAMQPHLQEAKVELERSIAERASRSEMVANAADLERRLGAVRSEATKAAETLQVHCSRLERELQAHMSDVQTWLSAKASVAELELRPSSAALEAALQRRPDFPQLHSEIEAQGTRTLNEARRGLGEMRAQMEEQNAALKAELMAALSALGGALRQKAERGELDKALLLKADHAEVRQWLQAKASVEEISAQLALRSHEIRGKVDGTQLRHACEQLEAKLRQLHEESRALLAVKLEAKTDREGLEAMVAQLLHKTNVQEAMALMQNKADVEDVNRSLMEVNRELSQRPTLTELNRVVGEQSLIMESLCSEHLLGRWIWKSGRTRGEKHAVPWNIQNINTNPENFVWEKDKCVITCAAPGLYEVTFGFFTRKKPSVQLLVNGEPVLSAINSATYAVHHSSGRLAAVGPHSAGNVTGLTLIDFLALPPKAKISCAYQGEEGEGFLGLRKM